MPRQLRWIVTGALVAIAFANPAAASASELLSDGFESGTFANWTRAVGGDGTSAVQSSLVKTGTYAARLKESNQPGSFSYLRKTLAPTRAELRVTGDFHLLQYGAPNGNVPFIRLFNTGGARMISLQRQNAERDKIFASYGTTHSLTLARMPVNEWHKLELRVIVNGAASTVEVRFDGRLVFQTASANLGTLPIQTVQIGNDTKSQTFEYAADNIVISDDSATNPDPTVPGTLFSDAFESGSLAAWSVKTATGGTAVAQSAIVNAGSFAARLSETSSAGSLANARALLATTRTALTATGQFRVISEGVSGGNVPILRLFDGTARVVSLIRQNATGGRLVLNYGGAFFSTSAFLPLGTWGKVDLQVNINGASSTVVARLNGAIIHQSSTANLGGGINAVQIGNEIAAQPFDIAVDDVVVTGP